MKTQPIIIIIIIIILYFADTLVHGGNFKHMSFK
jgi:hypothetical protein